MSLSSIVIKFMAHKLPLIHFFALDLKDRFYARRSFSLKFIDKYRAISEGAVSLDIGCGDTPRNIFSASVVMGCDIKENGKDILAVDLATENLPYDDNTFDFISAFDVLEHIPRVIYFDKNTRRQSFLELMMEIHRVLKPGGLFLSHTPVYPHPYTFVDPTHVNFITQRTFDYFVGPAPYASNYGYSGEFKYLENRKVHGHLVTLLQKET